MPAKEVRKMAVLMMLEVPGGTVEQYERVNEILEISDDGDAPDGLLYHVAARSDDGIVIADLWRSREDVERFFDERAGAAIAEAGMPDAEPLIAEVHHHSPGSGSEPATLVIIEADGATPELYDEMSGHMEAHAEGNTHPAVMHTAAIKPDGSIIVVDVWESPEMFAEFAQSQVAPAGEKVGLGPVEPRIHPVHNTLKGETAAAQ
jgi:heme-degrading monooxygenase HmoA